MLLLLTPALVMVVVLLICRALCLATAFSVGPRKGFPGQLHPDFPGKHLLGHLRPDLQDRFPW